MINERSEHPVNTHKECLCSVDGGTADKVYSSSRRIAVSAVRLGGGATQMKVEGGLMKQRVGTWLLVLASHWLATRQEWPLSHKRAIHELACRNAMPSFGFALSSLRHAFAVAERRSVLRDPKDRRSSSKSHANDPTKRALLLQNVQALPAARRVPVPMLRLLILHCFCALARVLFQAIPACLTVSRLSPDIASQK